MDDWTFLLERTLQSWRAAGKPSRVLAAVSGGADSAALLLVLAELSRKEGFRLSCAHVDHGIRPDSGQDAAFVEGLCRKMNVPCRIFRARLTGKSEEEARAARYDALLNSFPEEPDFALALAHHRRDQAETVLLHLLRGSGSQGLAGMSERSLRPRKGGTALLWRPFLDVSPELIRRALREKGVPWREDSTNVQDDYLRNYIRHRVLPVMEARLPRVQEALARSARIFADEKDYFLREAERFLTEENHACLYDPLRWVSYPALSALHPALRRHALRLICPVQLDWAQTEALAELRPGETVNLPEGWRAECTEEKLHFLPPKGMEFPVQPLMKHTLFVSPWDGKTGDGKRWQAMPRAVYEQCRLRAWQTGDRIQPLGVNGSKSMQDYFTDKKVPRPFRPYVPLLCIGGRVVWVIGVGPGEEARVRPGDDAVLIRYKGFLPGEGPDTQENKGENEHG